MYGLKQPSRAWYDQLSSFLLDTSFDKRYVDTTLFIKRIDFDIFLMQIYVDDICLVLPMILYVKNFLG